MSNLAISAIEQKEIDSQIEQMMDWAKTRQAEAEQLAMDSARLMACTGDRMDRLKNQGFFKRCWNRLSGKTGEMERANTGDLIAMQKKAFRYLNMLQEQQLLMAHSLLALKNNLVSLAVKEEETRNLIGLLAQKTQDRFEKLESRVDQLEISTNLQGWLLGLEERDYDEKYPTEYMRLFRVINDFYQIKRDNWNYNDLMFMRKAIRTVGLNPKQKISLNAFINTLTDEIQSEKVGFDAYDEAITLFKPEGIENYSKYVIDNISSPVFVSMHGLKTQYVDRLDIVETLEDEMNISKAEALKMLLRRSIGNMNVNLDYEFPLAETAVEILGCLRLAERLSICENYEKDGKADINSPAIQQSSDSKIGEINVPDHHRVIDIEKLQFGPWRDTVVRPKRKDFPVNNIIFFENSLLARSWEDDKIFISNDMSNWEVMSDTKQLGGISSTSPYYINKRLFAMSTDCQHIYTSGQGVNWSNMNLPLEAHGYEISYAKILFNEDIWLIWGTYGKGKHRNNFDINVSGDESIFMTGSSIDKLESTYAKKIFGDDIVINIIVSNGFFYAFTKKKTANIFKMGFKNNDALTPLWARASTIANTSTNKKVIQNNKLLKSKNGIDWESVSIDKLNYDDFDNIIGFGDKIIFNGEKSQSSCYFYDTKKEKLSPLKKIGKENNFDLDNLYFFENQNIGIYKGENQYLTNDLSNWIQIESAYSNTFKVTMCDKYIAALKFQEYGYPSSIRYMKIEEI